MTQSTRAKLSMRSKPVSETVVEPVSETVVETVVQPTSEIITYECLGTEIMFSDRAALIVHQGVEGDTLETVSANVDELLGDGAFAKLASTGVAMTQDGAPLCDPSKLYSLSVDPALMTAIVAAGATTMSTDEFIDDGVFSQASEDETVVDAAGTPDEVVEAPKGDQVDLDLTSADITFANTRHGVPCATLRFPGSRTLMAFGPVADALRGRSSASCILVSRRSTDKIVAVHIDDALVFEAPLAA